MVGLGKIGRLGPVGPDASPSPKPTLSALDPCVPQLVPRLSGLQWVRVTVISRLQPDLDSIDDRKPGGLRRLPKPRNTVEAVMIGNCQGLVTEFHGRLDQILGMGGAIEE